MTIYIIRTHETTSHEDTCDNISYDTCDNIPYDKCDYIPHVDTRDSIPYENTCDNNLQEYI